MSGFTQKDATEPHPHSTLRARHLVIGAALFIAAYILMAVQAGRTPPSEAPETPVLETAPNPMIGTLGTRILHYDDVRRQALADGLITDSETFPQDSPLFARARDHLIDRYVLADEALRLNLQTSVSAEQRLDRARTDILADLAVQAHIFDAVTEEKIRARFDAQAAVRRGGLQVRAKQILVPEEAIADDVLAKLAKGDDFATLAVAYSIDRASRETGGDMGYFSRDMLNEAITEAAFNAEVGTTIGPIGSERGWHILEITDRRRAPEPRYEDMRDNLRAILAKEALAELLTGLRDRADLTLYEADNTVSETAP